MGKLWKVCVMIAVTVTISWRRCNAATYFVGDGSGWDISTDFDSWTLGKTFNVGDVLLFQYSSPHSVYEVRRDSYKSCNTTKPLRALSSGNNTVTLSEPGWRFFVCGNKLHCFAGMRLRVDVHGGNEAPAPSPSPAAAPRAAVHPSSKRIRPATVVSSSGAGGVRMGIMGFLLSVFFFFFSLINYNVCDGLLE